MSNQRPSLKRPIHFEGAWVALIEGSSDENRFDRTFLKPISQAGRLKQYSFATDGIYECCPATFPDRHYYLFQSGQLKKLFREDVDKIFPPISFREQVPQGSMFDILFGPPTPPLDLTIVKSMLGPKGSLVSHEGLLWYVHQVESQHYWEDHEGFTHSGYPEGDVYRSSWTHSKTYLRIPTEEEIHEARKLDISSRIQAHCDLYQGCVGQGSKR